MIPKRDYYDNSLETTELPTKTYSMKLDGDKINNYKDELQAMEQFIYKVISTERYRHNIYSWNYGIELKDLFGKPIPYCCVEIERRIKECLLSDNRIKDVYNFEFEQPEYGVILCSFEVDTIFGATNIKKEVIVND